MLEKFKQMKDKVMRRDHHVPVHMDILTEKGFQHLHELTGIAVEQLKACRLEEQAFIGDLAVMGNVEAARQIAANTAVIYTNPRINDLVLETVAWKICDGFGHPDEVKHALTVDYNKLLQKYDQITHAGDLEWEDHCDDLKNFRVEEHA